jgi:hypothetical protein
MWETQPPVPAKPVEGIAKNKLYRVSIKSFPDYKHLLQENYEEYKHIFFLM